MRGATLAGVLVGLGLCAPVAMAASNPVTFSDPCGDSHGYLYVDNVHQDLPPTPRTPRFDLKGVAVSPTAGGVAVRLEMCAPIGDPDGVLGFRALYATLPDNCTLAVGEDEPVAPALPRHVHMIKECFSGSNQTLPLIPNNPDVRFDIDLPATVDGAAMTITVARAGLAGEAAAAFASGTRWRYLRAASTEGPVTYGFGFGTTGDYEANELPWGLDFADTTTPFTVG